MTKPESETDPWKAIQRYEFVQTNFAYTTDHEMERDAEGEWARWEAVDAARAAEAAQHQHEIAAKNAIIRTQAADLTTLKAGMKAQRDFYACEPWQSLETATARLAAVEAERDKAIDENIRLTNAEIEALRAERDRLKAALSQAAQDLETVGNDYPGSSCWQWCAERAGVARAALSGEGTAKP